MIVCEIVLDSCRAPGSPRRAPPAPLTPAGRSCGFTLLTATDEMMYKNVTVTWRTMRVAMLAVTMYRKLTLALRTVCVATCRWSAVNRPSALRANVQIAPRCETTTVVALSYLIDCTNSKVPCTEGYKTCPRHPWCRRHPCRANHVATGLAGWRGAQNQLEHRTISAHRRPRGRSPRDILHQARSSLVSAKQSHKRAP